MKITGFGIKNYRSFGNTGAMIEDYGKLNVFIGKNNSGKSNVLRFLRIVSQQNIDEKTFAQADIHRPLGGAVTFGLAFKFENEVNQCYFKKISPDSQFEIWIDCSNVRKPYCDKITLLETQGLVELYRSLTNDLVHNIAISIRDNRNEFIQRLANIIYTRLITEFKNNLKDLIYIPAIREVRTDSGIKNAEIVSGMNLISQLSKMQHPIKGLEEDQRRFEQIEHDVAYLLNVDNLAMEIPHGGDDIYLTIYGNRLSLSDYGTGVHELVIICSSLAIYQNRWVCIEEPEIHLHPELLRRFIRFLNTTNNTYFIATHSNVLLDMEQGVNIYHVSFDGRESFINRRLTNDHTRTILNDLAYQASDLLQTNGIIWVEGPSDRIYIKRWLELQGAKHIEGIHYSIMFYGGACLANLTADDSGPSDLIELLKINRNVIVVIDRDGTADCIELKEYKERIKNELGENKCWITEGREIENYLPSALIERYLKIKHPDNVMPVEFDQNEKIQECMNRALDGKIVNYDRAKVKCAHEISALMEPGDLACRDLKDWIRRIDELIKTWNNG